MKARKFTKRDRRTSGRATGTIFCRLLLPILQEKYDFRLTQINPKQAISAIRKFINRHLGKTDNLLFDASFVIEAEMRASSGGFRRKKLATWSFNDDVENVLNQATKKWNSLEFENDDYEPIEVDLSFDKNLS